MRKQITLPLLALLGGGAGAALRMWQQATAYDQETMLYRSGAPATLALVGLTALLALAFLALTRGEKREGDYPRSFACPCAGYMTLMTAASLLLLVSAGWGLMGGLQQMAVMSYGFAASLPILDLLTALLDLAAAAALLLLGKGNYRNALPKSYPLLVTLPAYAMLPWIVGMYQSGSRLAQIMAFAFPVVGGVCAVLSFYTAACFQFEKPRTGLCLFTGLMGAVLLLTSLGDLPGLGVMAKYAAVSLALLAQSYALLGNNESITSASDEEDINNG